MVDSACCDLLRRSFSRKVYQGNLDERTFAETGISCLRGLKADAGLDIVCRSRGGYLSGDLNESLVRYIIIARKFHACATKPVRISCLLLKTTST